MLKIIVNYKNIEKEYIFEKNTVVVGRSDKIDVTVASEYISREHLKISLINKKVMLTDLTSSNWVSYNGEKLEKNKIVEYYDFARLLLPDEIEIKIEHSALVEVDEKPEIISEKTRVTATQELPFKQNKDIYKKMLETKDRTPKSRLKRKDDSDYSTLIKYILAFIFITGLIYILFSAEKEQLTYIDPQINKAVV